jgi:hypothetical protein
VTRFRRRLTTALLVLWGVLFFVDAAAAIYWRDPVFYVGVVGAVVGVMVVLIIRSSLRRSLGEFPPEPTRRS